MASFNPQYVNLDRIEAAQLQRRANQLSPLDAALQGLQQGVQLQQLPETLQNQQLQRQLQNAIATQKLTDLANPQLAAQKAMQTQALEAILSGRNPNLVLQPQVDPELQAMRDVALEQAGVPAPTTDFRAVVPSINGIPAIGLSPSAGAQVKADELQRQIQLFNARPYNSTVTKEGYIFDPRNKTVSDAVINGSNLSDQRRSDVEAQDQAKMDRLNAQIASQERLLGRKLTSQETEAEKNRIANLERDQINNEARQTLANSRAKLAADVPVAASAYQAERQKRILDSVDDLEKDVGYDTVGFADWFKAVPTTEAKSFASRLKTLKAAIAFGELADMRAASKTGGALGQVSNIELGLLESSLGSLDQAQSPSEFKEELGKIKASIKRWRDESAKAAPKSAPNTSGMTRMIAADGSEVDIPSANVNAAIQRGAKVK